MQRTLDHKTRPKLRIGEMLRLIEKHRIITPPPSRSKLTKLCEEGVFETAGSQPSTFGWLVYEDSFWKWAAELDGKA